MEGRGRERQKKHKMKGERSQGKERPNKREENKETRKLYKKTIAFPWLCSFSLFFQLPRRASSSIFSAWVATMSVVATKRSAHFSSQTQLLINRNRRTQIHLEFVDFSKRGWHMVQSFEGKIALHLSTVLCCLAAEHAKKQENTRRIQL